MAGLRLSAIYQIDLAEEDIEELKKAAGDQDLNQFLVEYLEEQLYCGLEDQLAISELMEITIEPIKDEEYLYGNNQNH